MSRGKFPKLLTSANYRELRILFGDMVDYKYLKSVPKSEFGNEVV